MLKIKSRTITKTTITQVFSLYQKQRDDANTRNAAKCALFVRIINSKTRERTGGLPITIYILTKGMENFMKKWIFSQKVFILSSDSFDKRKTERTEHKHRQHTREEEEDIYIKSKRTISPA